jgi:hypothetical protein
MKCKLFAINNKEICLLSSVCKKIKEVTCKITAQNIANSVCNDKNSN